MKLIANPRWAEYCFVIFRDLRAEWRFADFLEILRRYRNGCLHNPHLLTVSNYFVDYPFEDPLLSNLLHNRKGESICNSE